VQKYNFFATWHTRAHSFSEKKRIFAPWRGLLRATKIIVY